MTGVFLRPSFARVIEDFRITGKVSSGYDDNIFEQAESKTGRSFLNLYLDSQFRLPRFKRLEGTFRLQNGFKTVKEEENIALNQVNLKFGIFISPKITSEIVHELKHKTVPASSNLPIQHEYGYLYWHSGLSLKFNGRNFNSSIRYLHRQQDYEDLDFSDSKTEQIQFSANAFLSPKLTGCFTGRIETIRFSGAEGYSRVEGVDNLYEFSLGFQWLDGILINPSYAFQINKSKSTEYSYYAHQWSILTALLLWRDITVQLYGRIQLREYDSLPPPLFYPSDEDDTDQLRKMLIFNISRDISKNCAFELQYMLSQSNPSMSSFRYKKQSYSFSVSYSFH